MKKNLFIMACMAAAVSFTACSDDSDEMGVVKQSQNLTFVAECPANESTRGVIHDENGVRPVWKGGMGGDYIRLYLSNHPEDDIVGNQIFFASEPLPEGMHEKATFNFPEVDVSDQDAEFIAVHNSSGGSHGMTCIYPRVDFENGTILFEEGVNYHEEGLNEDNFDNSREILVSHTDRIGSLRADGNNLLQFKRLNTMINIHIQDTQNLFADMWHWPVEFHLTSVEDEANNEGFTGSLSYNMRTGEVKRAPNGLNNGIKTFGFTSMENKSTLDAVFAAMPTKLKKGNHIRLYLSIRPLWAYKYTVIEMVRELKEDIDLKSGYVNTFNFTLEASDIIKNENK